VIPESSTTYRVNYDDQPEDSGESAIAACSDLIEQLGLEFEYEMSEELSGDGFIVYKVTLKQK
jgi:hypothetical protein